MADTSDPPVATAGEGVLDGLRSWPNRLAAMLMCGFATILGIVIEGQAGCDGSERAYLGLGLALAGSLLGAALGVLAGRRHWPLIVVGLALLATLIPDVGSYQAFCTVRL